MGFLSFLLSAVSWAVGWFKRPTADKALGKAEEIIRQQEITIEDFRNAQAIKDANRGLSHDELHEWVRSQQGHSE